MKSKRARSERRAATTCARAFLVILVILGVFTSGCSYFGRRLDDACDIFTATAEAKAVGFKAQMGPWGGFGIYGSDPDAFGAGFIGGQRTTYDYTDVTMPPLLGFVQKFRNFDDDRRRKEIHVVQSWFIPYLRPQTNPSGFSGGFREAGDWRRVAPRYTQVEVAIGFWGGIRLGMNFGELIDFLVGWTTLDIFGDDVPPAPEEWEAPVETETTSETEIQDPSETEAEAGPERESESPPDEGEFESDTDADDGWDADWDSDWGPDSESELEMEIDPSQP